MELFGVIICIFFVYLFKKAGKEPKKKNIQASTRFEVDGNCRCPYCNSVLDLNNGHHICPYCNNEFRKTEKGTLKRDKYIPPRIEVFVKVAAYLSVADGSVTQNEVNKLNQLLLDSGLGTRHINMCADLFNSYKNKSYDKYELLALRDYFNNDRGDSRPLVDGIYFISELDGGVTREQWRIIHDIFVLINYSHDEYEIKRRQYMSENIIGYPQYYWNTSYESLGKQSYHSSGKEKYNSSFTEEHKQIINCPYCNIAYDKSEDDFYTCAECNNVFKQVGYNTFKSEESLSFFVEYFVITLAYLAKADGQVTKAEVDYLKECLNVWKLDRNEMSLVAKLFNKYKNKSVSSSDITKFIKHFNLLDISIEQLLVIIKAFVNLDGGMSKGQSAIITMILQDLKVTRKFYDNIKIDEEQDVNDTSNKTSDEPYVILGLTPKATIEEIKKEYRRLIKIYHPDMQSSKDLPDEIMVDIRRKFDNIQNAYSALRERRKF